MHKRGAFWSPTLITDPLQSRTVVLRQLLLANDAMSEQPKFVFHTDIRSQKWPQLQQRADCALHFYCAKRKWQMRVKGFAHLHHDDDYAQSQWQNLSASGQKIYALQHQPGQAVADPEAAYSFSDAERAKANFAVICVCATELESLQLQRPDKSAYHVRAQWNIASHSVGFIAP